MRAVKSSARTTTEPRSHLRWKLALCLLAAGCARALPLPVPPSTAGVRSPVNGDARVYVPATLKPGGLIDDLWLGPATPADLLALGPRWQAQYDGYAPNTAEVTKLRVALAGRAGLHLDVVFGSWCGDSVREVPRFLKLVRALGPAAPPIRWIGVDRQKRDPTGLGLLHGTRNVPTFVVLVRNVEVGRIIESPDVSLETDLLRIVAAMKAS